MIERHEHGATNGHRAGGTHGQIMQSMSGRCENARNAPERRASRSHEDMIQSPASLLPHKAARAAPIAGGTTEKVRGAVIKRDWLLGLVIDRSPSPALL